LMDLLTVSSRDYRVG